MTDVDRLLAALLPFQNPERAEVGKGYTPTARRLLGISVPDLRATLKPFRAELKARPVDEARERILRIARADVHEIHHAAYELIAGLPRVRQTLSTEEVLGLADGNDNWASVDTWACEVGGPALKQGVLSDVDLLAWTVSPDRWRRRAALVCTVPLNMKSRGGTGDTRRTLRMCEPLATDGDPMVAKALSWALRELLEQDPEAVVAFLAAHAVPALVRREVGTKLRTGVKNPRRPAGGASPGR